jgi:hypothetical protein
MEEKLPPFKQSDFSSGMVSGVNESIKPQGAVGLALNFDFDYEIGSATTRLGTFIIGGQMVDGNSVLGLHNHVSGSTSKLFAAINDTDDATSVIYDDAGTVQVTGLTASKKTRFLTFIGSTLVLNGVDAERAWNGTTWITTGGVFDLANFPGSNLNNLCTVFLDRVYAAGDTVNPSRLYYSGVSSGTAVSWTAGNGYVDIDSGSEKGPITALAKVPGYILIFKTRAMSRWNFNSAFPEELVNTGTPSQESVVMGGGLCAFYSNSNETDKGFFITNGGRPQPISHDTTRPIKKWVDAIPASAESSIAGRATNRGFAWMVGDLTVDGQTYRNVELCYNRILNQWSVRTYPTKFTVYTNYLDGESKNVQVAGDNDGCIIQLDKADRYVDYITISGEPGEVGINFDIRTLPEKHTLNQLKEVSDKLVFETRNGNGATPYVLVDGKPAAEMESLDGDISEAKLPGNLKGNYFEYGVRGTVQGNRLTLKEIEVPIVKAVSSYN